MVTVSTLVMAASLVPVAAPPPSALSSGEEGEHATPIWRRPGFIMGALLIVLRLVAVSIVFCSTIVFCSFTPGASLGGSVTRGASTSPLLFWCW